MLLLYALVFFRGLWWQWHGIFTASRAAPPLAAIAAPRSATNLAPGGPASGAASAPGAAPAPAAQVGAKAPLQPTDEPPPRNAADRHGVFYDAQGVAVTGIDADPNGVYNVPPGRQVRIGGPAGPLFDVQPGGKITPATRVKEWPQ